MLRHACWIVSLGLLAVLAGCGDQPGSKMARHQFPPYHCPPTPSETPSDRHASPSPPPPITAAPTLPSLRGMKVVIDAGHGGKDPGTKGVSRLPEKSIVLAIANETARLLQDRGATVISTRTTDRFLELDDRAAIAERYRANLFVAIHADSAPRKSASGSTLFVARGASNSSLVAGRSIQYSLGSAGIECRGIQRANYRVLVGHSRPAVLVECGFLTNSTDAAKLNTQNYRSQIARAIARGVADYLSR